MTGSTHSTLVPYWARKLGKDRLLALQCSRRAGRLLCELDGERVRIIGKAVTYLRGIAIVPVVVRRRDSAARARVAPFIRRRAFINDVAVVDETRCATASIAARFCSTGTIVCPEAARSRRTVAGRVPSGFPSAARGDRLQHRPRRVDARRRAVGEPHEAVETSERRESGSARRRAVGDNLDERRAPAPAACSRVAAIRGSLARRG